jgi:hypothetical protein
MAIRMIVAMLVGTVLAFGWGAASWTSGLYDFAFRPFPGDTGAAIAAQVASSADRDGAFLYPSPPSAEGMT